MISYKLVFHDFRCGLSLKKLLFTVMVICIPLAQYFQILNMHNFSGNLGDCLLFVFRGERALNSTSGIHEKIQVPILWILLMILPQALNVDYFLNDLTSNGQQIMVRCQSRAHWMLSKCIWAVLYGFLYYLVILLCAIAGCILFRQRLSFSMTPFVADKVLEMDCVPLYQVLLTIVAKPIFAFASMNLIQITMQIAVRPIIALLICFSLVLCSLYCPAMCFPVSGAIALRNVYSPLTEIDCWIPVISAVTTGILCVFISIWNFSHMDLLEKEDY